MTLAFTRFDLMSWFPRRQTVLTLFFVVVVGAALPVPGMALFASAVVTSLMISSPFLGDERGRLDTLYGVLPVSRGTVVLGRALSLLTYHLAAAALATLATFVVAAVRGSQPSPALMLFVYAAAFAFVGLAFALQLPVFFKVGYSKGRLMAYAPVVVVTGLAWVSQATGLLDRVRESAAGLPTAPFVVLGFVLGLVGIAVGTVLATRIYRSREL